MDELSFTGNSVRGMCPILSFDSNFDTIDHLKGVKSALLHILKKEDGEADLVEIGPRFVLTLLKIFKSGFHGPTLYNNETFITPTSVQALLRQRGIINSHPDRYLQSKRLDVPRIPVDPLESVFADNAGISASD
ncbi:ribosome biogenesis protein Brx1 [Mitosporidium daphniae]|uniref:Ribosome biogenesis protein Brx1 n=1 Tax=Mitosporidium daphniae TaxID=1485682 RepID=A0A098VWF7_9MICR|nr:ribosome biogenesis protein Brx1 [Mitosporidium daphniae]KGG53219.1 ribosome biogenesis protein Brx1 [Mitosporidium daphniae]|eukprot:XP_013239655.1 ribosome biogenesis protein Brx1 [Mitosporidium daphniae]